jgi:hypothetical protein
MFFLAVVVPLRSAARLQPPGPSRIARLCRGSGVCPHAHLMMGSSEVRLDVMEHYGCMWFLNTSHRILSFPRDHCHATENPYTEKHTVQCHETGRRPKRALGVPPRAICIILRARQEPLRVAHLLRILVARRLQHHARSARCWRCRYRRVSPHAPTWLPQGVPQNCCHHHEETLPEVLVLAGTRFRGTARCERFTENAIGPGARLGPGMCHGQGRAQA